MRKPHQFQPGNIPANKKHGLWDTRIYRIWYNMHRRCEWDGHVAYDRYGGRGINVCEEWADPVAFFEWANANGYSDTLTLDRIDTDGNYTPDNCRFVSFSVQAANKTNNINIAAFGETKTLSAWSRDARCSITAPGIKKRLAAGWNPEQAISTPAHN